MKASGPYEATLWTKLVEVMEFQLSYFTFLKKKTVLLNCCTQYGSKFGNHSSGQRTGNFSFQSQRKAMWKNVQTQLNSSHKLANDAQNSPIQASTVCEPWASRCSSCIRKGRGTRDQVANICCINTKPREFQKNIYFCFLDYAKAFDCGDHNKPWKNLKEMVIRDYLGYAGQEAAY